MSYYFKLGAVPHKRHTQFRQPDGTIALFCGLAHARRLRASASRLSGRRPWV